MNLEAIPPTLKKKFTHLQETTVQPFFERFQVIFVYILYNYFVDKEDTLNGNSMTLGYSDCTVSR
jgi:hypothetical protein